MPLTDIRPPDYSVPVSQQDADLGRLAPHESLLDSDGQEVVDLLNQPGQDVFEPPEQEEEPTVAREDDIGTSNPPYYGDLRPSASSSTLATLGDWRHGDVSAMLYGPGGTLTSA